jgi:protein-L-isoaspartate(D-aspartate) O-methyltransferase
MNLEQARINMLKGQIRTWGILAEDILNLLQATPREEFVPAVYRKLAFADLNLPIGTNEVMLTPMEEARMIQALAVKPSDSVLEVGTGSGYTTALLAKQAKHVYSVDINPDFIDNTQAKLKQQGIFNVSLTIADAAKGWNEKQPYDVIAITGSLPLLPASFKHSLALGGRLFAILGQGPSMQATLITRIDDQAWQTEKLFETQLPPLHNALQTDPFVF